jgi:hypothetical protein
MDVEGTRRQRAGSERMIFLIFPLDVSQETLSRLGPQSPARSEDRPPIIDRHNGLPQLTLEFRPARGPLES